MRGKKPGNRGTYVLRMKDGTLVEVSKDVYQEWHQFKRREKYQKEKSRLNRVCSFEALNVSDCGIVTVTDSLEETAIRNLCREKVREVLQELSDEDARLIYTLFYEEVSVTEAARLFG